MDALSLTRAIPALYQARAPTLTHGFGSYVPEQCHKPRIKLQTLEKENDVCPRKQTFLCVSLLCCKSCVRESSHAVQQLTVCAM